MLNVVTLPPAKSVYLTFLKLVKVEHLSQFLFFSTKKVERTSIQAGDSIRAFRQIEGEFFTQRREEAAIDQRFPKTRYHIMLNWGVNNLFKRRTPSQPKLI